MIPAHEEGRSLETRFGLSAGASGAGLHGVGAFQRRLASRRALCQKIPALACSRVGRAAEASGQPGRTGGLYLLRALLPVERAGELSPANREKQGTHSGQNVAQDRLYRLGRAVSCLPKLDGRYRGHAAQAGVPDTRPGIRAGTKAVCGGRDRQGGAQTESGALSQGKARLRAVLELLQRCRLRGQTEAPGSPAARCRRRKSITGLRRAGWFWISAARYAGQQRVVGSGRSAPCRPDSRSSKFLPDRRSALPPDRGRSSFRTRDL